MEDELRPVVRDLSEKRPIKNASITALFCGIFSIVMLLVPLFPVLLGIGGVCCGFYALGKEKGKWMPVTGIVLSLFGIFIGIIMLYLYLDGDMIL